MMVLHLLLLAVTLLRVSAGQGIVELKKLFEQHSAHYVKDLEELVGGCLHRWIISRCMPPPYP